MKICHTLVTKCVKMSNEAIFGVDCIYHMDLRADKN